LYIPQQPFKTLFILLNIVKSLSSHRGEEKSEMQMTEGGRNIRLFENVWK
jgi:hypothetical protein